MTVTTTNQDAAPPANLPAEVVRMMRDCPLRWIVPTVVCTLLAIGYALFRADTWQASQALVVRNEGSSNSSWLEVGR